MTRSSAGHLRGSSLRRCVARRVLDAALLASMAASCQPSPARPPATPMPDRIRIFAGNVHLDNGEELAYRAILAPDPTAPGRHIGTIDIPMQALSGASLERVVFEPGRRVEFSLPLPGKPRWAGVVASDGAIACEFRQGEVRLLCSMSDVGPRAQ